MFLQQVKPNLAVRDGAVRCKFLYLIVGCEAASVPATIIVRLVARNNSVRLLRPKRLD